MKSRLTYQTVSDLLLLSSKCFWFALCQQMIGPQHIFHVFLLCGCIIFPRGWKFTILWMFTMGHGVCGTQYIYLYLNGFGSKLANPWLMYLNSAPLGFHLVNIKKRINHWVIFIYNVTHSYVIHSSFDLMSYTYRSWFVVDKWSEFNNIFLNATLTRVP